MPGGRHACCAKEQVGVQASLDPHEAALASPNKCNKTMDIFYLPLDKPLHSRFFCHVVAFALLPVDARKPMLNACQSLTSIECLTPRCTARYVILPKDFERGYKANIKKSDSEFAFYQ